MSESVSIRELHAEPAHDAIDALPDELRWEQPRQQLQ